MGAGAWGTALAKVLADAGNDVTLWARRAELADEINDTHRNPDYLGDVELPASIRATSDPAEALTGACTVLLAVPSQTLARQPRASGAGCIGADATLVSVAKGIELDTLMRMSQVIVQVTGADPSRVAVVTGPNLASEIADEQPAATVVACTDSGRAVTLQRAFSTGYFRPYTNSDVVGAEIGGACKNVIALACGMAAGVGLGENTVGGDHHPRPRRDHAAGNCVGRQGRHAGRPGRRRRPGRHVHLAAVAQPDVRCAARQGRHAWSPRCAAAGGHVAEGVTSCQSVLALAASYDVEMPLTDAVHRVCHKGLSVDEAVALLLGRSTKPE